jgi:hypothetical protein
MPIIQIIMIIFIIGLKPTPESSDSVGRDRRKAPQITRIKVRKMILSSMDNLVTKLATMERGDLIYLLKHMTCTFPMDFTEEFLDTIGTDRLRHIVLAAKMHELKAA